MKFFDEVRALHNGGDSYALYNAHTKDEAGDPSYYGFLNSEGRWLILEVNDSAGTFQYLFGKTGFATSWTNRASNTYYDLNTATESGNILP